MCSATYEAKGQEEIREEGQIRLMFQSQGEYVTLKIDRKSKRVWLTSSKTNYLEQEMPWSSLWDKGKEKEQDKVASKLSDKEFRALFIKQMALNGYKLIG